MGVGVGWGCGWSGGGEGAEGEGLSCRESAERAAFQARAAADGRQRAAVAGVLEQHSSFQAVGKGGDR